MSYFVHASSSAPNGKLECYNRRYEDERKKFALADYRRLIASSKYTYVVLEWTDDEDIGNIGN